MGVNLLEALRQGQVDAGLVQEPALTLVNRGGRPVLMNAMDIGESSAISAAPSSSWASLARQGDRRAQAGDGRLDRGAADALKALRTMSADQLSRGFPKEMTTGLDLKDSARSSCAHRNSLYPKQ